MDEDQLNIPIIVFIQIMVTVSEKTLALRKRKLPILQSWV